MIRVTYLLTCDAPGCDVGEVLANVTPGPGERLPEAMTSDGWTAVGHRHYCPAHDVDAVVTPAGGHRFAPVGDGCEVARLTGQGAPVVRAG